MAHQHLTRGNRQIVCAPCQRDEHQNCLDGRNSDAGLVCHCKTCHPAPCETCFPPRPDGQNRQGQRCSSCQTEMPLTNICEYCL